MLGELLYETANIAYDTTSKQFIDPTSNVVFGPNPPPGGWPISWYMGGDNTPVPVNTTETAAQIAADLAKANVVPTATPIVSATPSISDWLSGTSFGVSNMVIVGGVAVVGFLMLKGK